MEKFKNKNTVPLLIQILQPPVALYPYKPMNTVYMISYVKGGGGAMF